MFALQHISYTLLIHVKRCNVMHDRMKRITCGDHHIYVLYNVMQLAKAMVCAGPMVQDRGCTQAVTRLQWPFHNRHLAMSSFPLPDPFDQECGIQQ